MADSTKNTTLPANVKGRDEAWYDYVERMVLAERERCAKFVEEECVYIVGRIQAAAIGGKIRESANER